jgi:hypothetical protein
VGMTGLVETVANGLELDLATAVSQRGRRLGRRPHHRLTG